MGIRHIILAVNKMDLVGYDENVFQKIAIVYREFAGNSNLSLQAIPISAAHGENITHSSHSMRWYSGPSVLQYLDEVQISGANQLSAGCNNYPDRTEQPSRSPFRMPVQRVCRPDASYRGFSGRIAFGTVKSGDKVRVLPSGVQTRVQTIDFWKDSLESASAGASVTLTLEDEVGASRGNVIVAAEAPVEVSDQFQATLIWMSENPLIPERPYFLRLHTQEVSAQVTRLCFREEIETGKHLAARQLELNEIA
jgi:bifunctional enzyme CysN/CysC